MSILKYISILILRSLFLYGLTPLRKSSSILSIVYLVICIYIAINLNPLLVLIPTTIVAILYRKFNMTKLFLYSFLLTSIPSLWMSLTQLALDIAMGNPYSLKWVFIYIRAESIALNTMFVLHTINISEIALITYRISRVLGISTYLFWRALSQLLREAIELSQIHKLKGVEIWRTLAILFLRSDEMSIQFEESLYLKKEILRPRTIYSIKSIATQIMLIALCIALFHPYIHTVFYTIADQLYQFFEFIVNYLSKIFNWIFRVINSYI